VHPWLIWLILAAALAAAEALSLDLVLIMCAGGAAAGGVAAVAGAPPAGQVAVAVAGAVVLLLFVRPVARRHLSGAGTARTGSEALVGASAIVLSRVDSSQHGRVRLNGGEWSARAFDETQVIEVGRTVQVMQISGATAVVWDSSA
jgi:membrane protein implicated in regulation of membrane protease activity